jgi:hypothetical protein
VPGRRDHQLDPQVARLAGGEVLQAGPAEGEAQEARRQPAHGTHLDGVGHERAQGGAGHRTAPTSAYGRDRGGPVAADGDDERCAGEGVGHDAAAQAEDVLDDRLGEDLGRCAGGDDPSSLERDEVVGVAGRQVEVVQDGDDGRAAGAVEVDEQVEHLDLVGDVEVGGRLVEQEHVGVLRERHGDPDPLALAARQLVDPSSGELEAARHLEGAGDGALVVRGPRAEPALVGERPRPTRSATEMPSGAVGGLGEQPEGARDLPARQVGDRPARRAAPARRTAPSAARGRAAASTSRRRWRRRWS